MEKNKENAPASRKSLDFGNTELATSGGDAARMTVPTSLKPHDTNVFTSGKRGRGSEDSDVLQVDTDNTLPTAASRNEDLNLDLRRSEKTPSAKRQRVGANEKVEVDAFGDVLSDIGNVSSTFSQVSQTPRYRVPRMGERKVYKRIPLDSDYVFVTVDSGERFYLR